MYIFTTRVCNVINSMKTILKKVRLSVVFVRSDLLIYHTSVSVVSPDTVVLLSSACTGLGQDVLSCS